jgi:hypothetical protein
MKSHPPQNFNVSGMLPIVQVRRSINLRTFVFKFYSQRKHKLKWRQRKL